MSFPGFFMEKAKAIDPVVEHYISQVLAKKAASRASLQIVHGHFIFCKTCGQHQTYKSLQTGA